MVRAAGAEAAISHRDRISNLTSVMRDSAAAAAAAAASASAAPPVTRRDKLLGAIPGAIPLPRSGGDPGFEFKEEDVWEIDTSGRQTPPPPPPPPLPAPQQFPNFLEGGGKFRRSWLDNGGGAGLGLSSLSRAADSSSANLTRVESSSRMIPQSVASSNASSSNSSAISLSKLGAMSAPVNVPDWSKLRAAHRDRNAAARNGLTEDLEDDDAGGDSDDDDERLPPHILVARSQATTFSVFEGHGRTLKGRDLSRVRNAVLKQTGFL